MALQTTQTLASLLSRGVGLGIRKAESIEETEERNRELARSVKAIERRRKAQKKTGLGRLFGALTGGAATLGLPAILSALGAPATGGLSLLIPALAAGAGSFIGQKVATDPKWRPRGAKRPFEKLSPIDVGAFQVSRGREREEEFRLGERGFREDLSGGILSSAVSGAFSAAAFQNWLQGRNPLTRAFQPGELSLPQMPITGGPGFRGGAAPGSSLQQSFIRALGGTP